MAKRLLFVLAIWVLLAAPAGCGKSPDPVVLSPADNKPEQETPSDPNTPAAAKAGYVLVDRTAELGGVVAQGAYVNVLDADGDRALCACQEAGSPGEALRIVNLATGAVEQVSFPSTDTSAEIYYTRGLLMKNGIAVLQQLTYKGGQPTSTLLRVLLPDGSATMVHFDDLKNVRFDLTRMADGTVCLCIIHLDADGIPSEYEYYIVLDDGELQYLNTTISEAVFFSAGHYATVHCDEKPDGSMVIAALFNENGEKTATKVANVDAFYLFRVARAMDGDKLFLYLDNDGGDDARTLIFSADSDVVKANVPGAYQYRDSNQTAAVYTADDRLYVLSAATGYEPVAFDLGGVFFDPVSVRVAARGPDGFLLYDYAMTAVAVLMPQ